MMIWVLQRWIFIPVYSCFSPPSVLWSLSPPTGDIQYNCLTASLSWGEKLKVIYLQCFMQDFLTKPSSLRPGCYFLSRACFSPLNIWSSLSPLGTAGDQFLCGNAEFKKILVFRELDERCQHTDKLSELLSNLMKFAVNQELSHTDLRRISLHSLISISLIMWSRKGLTLEKRAEWVFPDFWTSSYGQSHPEHKARFQLSKQNPCCHAWQINLMFLNVFLNNSSQGRV